MSSSLSATLTATLQATYQNSNSISTPIDQPAVTQKESLQNGTGANKAQKIAYGQWAFTPGQVQTINLSSLTDSFGVSFSLVGVGVKGLFFQNLTTTTGSFFEIRPGASNGWVVLPSGSDYSPFWTTSRGLVLGAGGVHVDTAPVDSFQVPDGTHCTIDIYSALAATLNWFIWG